MSGHTPGPWVESQLDGLVGSDGERVLFGGFRAGLVPVTGYPRAAANTRLAYAAPDLLAACEAALDPNVSMGLADKMLRAAIAKATGAVK